MKRLLLTGFDPFAGYMENPSAQLASALAMEGVEGFQARAVLLPVSFQKSFEFLQSQIERFRPDFVVAFGLAVGRAEITPERIAINFMDSEMPDNDGLKPKGMRIREDGEDGIFSNLPIAEMVARAQAINVPAKVSNTAGTFVCNYILYRLLEIATEGGFQAGFVHLPLLPHQAKGEQASMPFSQMRQGARAMLSALRVEKEFSGVDNFDAAVVTSNRLPI